ncbi:MAG TPA: PAS domain S-box protein, partial [Candidatus Acidoferrum sp.]|nr:PAS domain S-box protein [Candidatus Acidoferrum sp.]
MPLNVSDKQRDTEFEQEPQSHHQESLLRSALNSLTNSVFILEVKPNSRTRIIVDCNTAALKAFGYGKNELIGKPINLLHVSNETLVEFERLLYSAAEKNKLPFDLPEFHMKRKDGTILTTEHTVARLLNDKGELTGWVSVIRDISERKKAESALKESEERYHSLFQTMMEGSAYCRMIFDENDRPVDFVYLDVNSAFSRLTGLTNVVGKRVTEVIPRIREENPELFEIYGKVVLTGHPEQFESDLRSSLGVILEISVFSPMDEHFVAVFEDITERKRLEGELKQHAQHLAELVTEKTAKLQESEERYRFAKEQLEYAVFSNPAVVYVGKPLPDQSDFWATFVSKSVSSLLGFEPDQLTGESGARFWQSRLPAEDVQKFLAEMPLLWRDGRHAFEYRFLHKDGEYRWIREEQRVIRDREGNVRDVVGYWIDISKEKTLEEALHKSEQNLRKANENLELGIVETTEQIENIAKLREKLRQTPDLSTGLEMVLETILWEFGMDIGAIFAFDRGKGLANLQAMKARTEEVSLQQTYSLNTGLVEFEATPAKNVAELIAEGDNSVLKTKSVYSTAIIIGNDVYGVLTFGGNKTEKLSDVDLIILEFYTELISQTITERRLTVKPVREREEGTAPTSWPAPNKRPELEVGVIYITKNGQSFAYET